MPKHTARCSLCPRFVRQGTTVCQGCTARVLARQPLVGRVRTRPAPTGTALADQPTCREIARDSRRQKLRGSLWTLGFVGALVTSSLWYLGVL